MCRPGGRIIYKPPGVVPKPVSPWQSQPQKQHACPLTGVEANVVIRDFCASIALSQKFQNVEDQPIEAVYQFPLNEKYCICDFTAEIDGKVIKGQCKEKEEAKDIYEDAIAEGHGAYLLEESDDPNIFKVSVGNLPPGKEVNITITYVAELEFVEGVLQWLLASSPEEDGPSSPYYRSSTSKVALPGLKLKIDLDMTSNIRSLSSPSHPISFEFGEEPTKAVVTLGDSAQSVTKDFVLNVKLAKPHQPCAKVQKDSKGNMAAMVALYPEITLEEDEEIYTECVFLIDRSGSMSGSRINQVRDTMQIFLRSLGEGTMFNIVGFGTRSDFLFKNGSVEYNDNNLNIATNHIATLAANLGGTNILTPLKEILKAPTVEGYPRQLFILTDGEVSNTQECIDFVRKNSHTTRVFTFGIGNEASQDLVKGMAKAGEGFFEFILPGENMEEKVLKQLGRAMQPSLTDISVDWGELVAEQAPFRLPPLFLGGRIVVYGFLPEGSKAGTVTLKAKTAIKPFETTVELKPEEAVEGKLFHQLGAKQLIRDLQEGRSFMHTVDGALMPGKSAKVKQEMIRLSTSYGVLCPHTAFVAVEEREEATEGTMQVRKVGIDTAPPSESGKQVKKEKAEKKKGGGLNFLSKKKNSASPSKDSGAVKRRMVTTTTATTAMPSRSLSLQRDSASGGGGGGPVGRGAPPSRAGGGRGGGAPQPVQGGPPRPMAPAARCPPPSSSSLSPASPRSNSASFKSLAPSSPVLSSSFSSMAPPPSPSASYGAPPPPPPSSDSYGAPPPPGPPAPPMAPMRGGPPPPAGGAPPRPQQSQQPQQPQLQQQQQPQSGGSPMKTIIMKQKANGSWVLSDVAGLLGSLSAEAIKKALATLVPDASPDAEAVWVTAVVCAYFEKHYSDQKTNWDFVVKKAKRWTSKQAKALKIEADLSGEAAKLVEAN